MSASTLYSTYKQVYPNTKTVYLIVINKWLAEDKAQKYTLLNLDGNLNTTDVTETELTNLLTKNILQPWKP